VRQNGWQDAERLGVSADPKHRLAVRVITEYAWHSLFAHNLFIRPNADELLNFEPDLTIVSVPSVKADPKRDGTRSETFVLVNLARRIVIIAGLIILNDVFII